MVNLEQVLIFNAGLFSVILILLLLFSMRKNGKYKDNKKHLTKDLRDIKEQISDNE